MAYYHVYIEATVGETEETDFSREQLLKDIVKPYSQNKKFLCKGVVIVPNEILAIQILETEQPSSEVLKKIRAERGAGAGLLGDIFGSDFDLLEKGAKDVTREFLTVRAEKRRKRISRKKAPARPSNNVFIVHGRDYEPIRELKAMLTEFGLNPIVLHEQPSGSMTIVEKLEKYSDVGYAFVVLTPDDGSFNLQTLKEIVTKHEAIRLPRPQKDDVFMKSFLPILTKVSRQNAILEFGYFIGKLGRDRVCCLYKGGVELPSDMHGIVYIPFKVTINEVRGKIIRELEEANYKIKM